MLTAAPKIASCSVTWRILNASDKPSRLEARAAYKSSQVQEATAPFNRLRVATARSFAGSIDIFSGSFGKGLVVFRWVRYPP